MKRSAVIFHRHAASDGDLLGRARGYFKLSAVIFRARGYFKMNRPLSVNAFRPEPTSPSDRGSGSLLKVGPGAKYYGAHFLAILFIAALFSSAAAAAEIKPKRIVTENGITLLLVEQHSLPLVSVEALIDAGAIYDPNEKAGLAALTASLLEEGTKKRSAPQISEAVDFIGANLSASADEDFMTADLKVVKKDAEAGLDLLSDILINPIFDPKEVERVRNNLLGALIAEKDQPQVIAERAFRNIIFGNHPYHHPVNGREETVPKITREEIAAFHRDFYRPNNMILSIVGDLSEKEATDLVKKYFGKWEKRPVPFPKINPPSPFGTKKVELIEKELAQATVVLGHVGIERSNPDYYAVTVMNYILGGGGFSSRMLSDIRDNRGLVYSIYSRFDAKRQPGHFAVSLQTKSGSANEAIEGVLQEIKKIRSAPVTDDEISEAKAYLVGSFPLRLDTTGKLAGLLSAVEFYRLGLDYLKKYPEYVNKVTKEDVLRVAQKYLHPDAYALVVVGNQNEAKVKQ